jgi:hypothetical protein
MILAFMLWRASAADGATLDQGKSKHEKILVRLGAVLFPKDSTRPVWLWQDAARFVSRPAR